MPPPYSPVTVEPRQGGALNTQDSPENVGPANYVLKRDWRRDFDGEARREGDVLFQPSSGAINNQPHPEVGSPITLVHSCRRANGQVAAVVGTQTTLYRYFTFNDGNSYNGCYTNCYTNESGDWHIIGQNFSTNGARWEAVDVAGYTIFNNGYDLPVAYDLSKRYVVPLYELREQGIAAVGTITSFNGMLLCQDITNMTAAYTSSCLNGVSSGAITATQASTVVTTSSSFFTAAMVGQTIVYAKGFPARITAVITGTSATVDTAQNVAAATFTVAVLFGAATDPLQTSRIRYQIINSNVGDPTAFGSLSTALVTAGSPKVTFTQPMYSLNVGDSVILTGVGTDGSAIVANVLAIDNVNHSYVYIDQLPLESTENVTFTVAATANTGSLSYQWMYNSAAIQGATSASYTLSNISTANAGNYNCVISDSSGSVSSAATALTIYGVAQPPIITTQPASLSVSQNNRANPATFSVSVLSNDPVSYQWALNGANIPGATGSVFTIPSVYENMQGLYTCTITNSEGSITSNSAQLTVAPAPTWTPVTFIQQPVNTSAVAGSSVVIQMQATSVPTYTGVWIKHLGSILINTGQTGNQLVFPCVKASDAGNYYYQATNPGNGVGLNSTQITLTVTAPVSGPTITTQLVSTETLFAPAHASIQKAAYPGSAISSQNLQDDGSAIIRSIDLRGTLVIFKETTIFIGTFTGTVGGPISYQKIYSGPDCLYWKWMLTVVDGTYVIYATQKDFFTFDLTLLLPRKHPQLRNASIFYDLMFTSAVQDQCFAATNELTREVWFMFPSSPDGALCFDFEWNTCSTLGTAYTAAATIDLPTSSVLSDPKRVFVMGDSSGTIRTYGLDTETGSTYQRNGANYDSTLSAGYVSFADEYGEKDLRGYMAFCRGTAPFIVNLSGTPDVQEALTQLFTVAISAPTYQTLIPCFYRQNYYQDTIVVSGSANPCAMVRRLFDTSKIDSRGTIKHM